jgi:hypothetical protein
VKRSRKGLRRRYGHAASKSGWASGRRPSHSEIWANGKPIEIRKIGSKWAVDVMQHPIIRLPSGGLTFRGRADFSDSDDNRVALFSKSDAEHVAHKVGRYMLDLGDHVYTYVRNLT